MHGVIPSTPQHVFMARCLVKHRDTFTGAPACPRRASFANYLGRCRPWSIYSGFPGLFLKFIITFESADTSSPATWSLAQPTAMWCGVPITMVRHVLGLRMEETASRCRWKLRMYWVSSRGQSASGSPPAWGWGRDLQLTVRKSVCYEMLHSASDFAGSLWTR
jgi:hypothetical protein